MRPTPPGGDHEDHKYGQHDFWAHHGKTLIPCTLTTSSSLRPTAKKRLPTNTPISAAMTASVEATAREVFASTPTRRRAAKRRSRRSTPKRVEVAILEASATRG